MRLIPGKTKVKIELFRGIRLGDIIVSVITVGLVGLVFMSTIPGRIYISAALLILGGLLVVRMDEVSNYTLILNLLRFISLPRAFARKKTDDLIVPKEEEEESNPEGSESVEEEVVWMESEQNEETENAEDSKEQKDTKSKESSKKTAGSTVPAAKKQQGKLRRMADIMPFTGISEGRIEYAGKYYATVIEIDPVEFRFFSTYRRNSAIESCFGRVLRSVKSGSSANIIKLERPILYDSYLQKEYEKLRTLITSYEKGMFSEAELQARVEIEYDRIRELEKICFEQKVIQPFYYFALFNSNKRQLELDTANALEAFRQAELVTRRLVKDRDLALFLKYTNTIDFDEKDVDKVDPKDYMDWVMPENVSFNSRYSKVNKIVTHQMRVVNYPSEVGDSWMAGVMSMPNTKVVVKISPMEITKSVKAIDHSLQELRDQLNSTGIDSRRIELEGHITTLSQLLMTLKQENENLLNVNIYISIYDTQRTAELGDTETAEKSEYVKIADLKKTVRRTWSEAGIRLSAMDFAQLEGFIGAQVSAYDPMEKDGRGMPSNTIAAMYPWIFARVSDPGGVRLGTHDGVPVFINFFRRDSERINSNMVIIGKSGSGKSYGTKSLLTNMAAEDSKIFILDPENEYLELAHTLHGKIINVGNASQGRLNPFHIITSLEDDEADTPTTGSSYAAHLQFLEEFFKQILPDVDKDALEYLNSLVERLYTNFGITAESNLSKLSPEDYPIFDDLYDLVLEDFQRNSNEYLRSLLQTLMNYVSKFATGGRNSNIWNGPSSVTTDENFSVFNFQSLLANRNTTIANAQMLLVLKYIDNEIIKNREYNRKFNLLRKVIVVIDEAHVFIDPKYPIALDFMFQLAKRIRKYNGMQIVITQNIKDFVGSEEIARKSTAIINACQYSFIFSLAPNDMDDLCKLYEKAGGINEVEQDQIVTAPRGTAFTVLSPASRSSFKIEVPQTMVDMFEQPNYQTHYFDTEVGLQGWEDLVGNSREEHDRNVALKIPEYMLYQDENEETEDSVDFTFSEITSEEAEQIAREYRKANPTSKYPSFSQYKGHDEEEEEDDDDDFSFTEESGKPDRTDDFDFEDDEDEYGYEEDEDEDDFDFEEDDEEDEDDFGFEEDDEEDDFGFEEEEAYEDDEDDRVPVNLSKNRPPVAESSFDDDGEDMEIPHERVNLSKAGAKTNLKKKPLPAEEDNDDNGFVPQFDIMSLLDEQVQSYGDMGLAEKMDEIDVDTMEISLDELDKYIKEMRKRR